MKIAVNARLLILNKLEGIGWFTYQVLKRIIENNHEHEFHLIYDRKIEQNISFNGNVVSHVTFPQARHPILWYLFFEYGVPSVIKKVKPDLFLSTDGWIPLNIDTKIVNVIHDLNFEHNHEFIKPITLAYYKKFFCQFAKKSDRIAAVSEFTKNDIHKTYNIDLNKIDVVYNGVNECFKPLSNCEKEKIKTQYSDGCPFFIFVGLIHKRKNLINIFKAFDKFKIEDNFNYKLVIVGEKKWWTGEIEHSFNSMIYKNDVIFLGRQESNILANLMASSDALLYPSLFEGFGIPILEAFNAETAIITSNITSMPEIAKDAAILVDPYSAEQIADAMIKLSSDQNLRQSLIEKGKQYRVKYSWNITADKLWQSIEKVII